MCRNGHDAPTIVRPDGWNHCAECKRLSDQRRNRRYYEKHKVRVRARQAGRDRTRMFG